MFVSSSRYVESLINPYRSHRLVNIPHYPCFTSTGWSQETRSSAPHRKGFDEVDRLNHNERLIKLTLAPVLPLPAGLCLQVKLQRCLPFKHKLEIYITEGTHSTEEDINKQINDKERVAAAMENPNLREIVEQCVTEPDDWVRLTPHRLHVFAFSNGLEG